MVGTRRGMRAGVALAAVSALGLSGCVVAPPIVVPQQVPYVAVPGPTKTEAQFHQDDATCRAAAVVLPPGPGVTVPVQGSAQGAAAGAAAPAGAYPAEPPGVSYLRCMSVRNNVIEPMPQAAPALYAYSASYPVFVGGYGDYYPWLYGGPFGLYGPGFYGLGFYGGYGYRGGFGYRGGYGYGFRGGYGGYGGGFHGGYGGGYGGGGGFGGHGGGGGRR